MTESVQLERDLVEPIERVWTALTDVDSLAMWFGSNHDMDLEVMANVATGGAFHLVVPDEYILEGTFNEVTEPSRIELAWRDQSLSDRPRVGTDDEDALLTFELSPNAVGTTLTLTQTGIVDAAAAQRQAQSWDRALGRLVGVL